jgi:hypothetical protein
MLLQCCAEYQIPFLAFLDDGQRAAIEQLCGLGQANPSFVKQFDDVPSGTDIQELPQRGRTIDLLILGTQICQFQQMLWETDRVRHRFHGESPPEDLFGFRGGKASRFDRAIR